MHVELSCYDHTLDKKSVLDFVFASAEHHLSGISLPASTLCDCREFLPQDILISCPIDYPYGLSDIKCKIAQVVKAKQLTFNAIDYIPNIFDINNKNLNSIKKELSTVAIYCNENNLTLRIVLDFRWIVEEKLFQLCEVIKSLDIEYIITSTSVGLVSFVDSVIYGINIQDKYGLSSIINCNVYGLANIEILQKSSLYGIKINNLSVLNQKIWCIK